MLKWFLKSLGTFLKNIFVNCRQSFQNFFENQVKDFLKVFEEFGDNVFERFLEKLSYKPLEKYLNSWLVMLFRQYMYNRTLLKSF